MSKILIERVWDGWKVTRQDPASYLPGISYYQSIEDLKNALPELLAYESEPFEMPEPIGVKLEKIERI